MGVYINMEMPKSCDVCRFNGAYCYAKGDEDAHSTLPCPLIPVPPHGRLIDADELYDLLMNLADNEYTPKVFASWLSYEGNAPTIIEADET